MTKKWQGYPALPFLFLSVVIPAMYPRLLGSSKACGISNIPKKPRGDEDL